MKNILILLFLNFSFFANAQQVCNQTVVYFDSDKFDLKDSEKQKIDSLIQISGAEILVKLYGHTDSLKNDEYNDTLSFNRVNTVKQYLEGFQNINFSIKKYHFGEKNPKVENSSDENKALNRRVEILFIPLEKGQIVFNGKKGEKAKIPIEEFNDCDVCELKPVFKSYATEQEANEAGIDLITEDGFELITGGMMCFDFSNIDEICPELKDSCIQMELSMPSANIDPSMSAYILNNQGRWYSDDNEATIVRDSSKCIIIGCLTLADAVIVMFANQNATLN
jgi:hypothetical protein